MISFPLDCRWEPARAPAALAALPEPPPADTQSLRLTLRAERRTGFRFHLDFLEAGLRDGYRIDITVEWQGETVVDLPACALQPIGQPVGWGAVAAARLSADEPARGDLLVLQSVAFSARVVPRPVNPREHALETFFVQSFWRVDQWTVESSLPPDRRELQSFWFWAQLVMQRPAPGDWVSMRRDYPGGVPLADYDALIALVSFERSATCAIELRLDGEWRACVPAAAGAQDFRELIAGLDGAARLDAIRLRMTCAAPDVATLTGVVSWILAQVEGARPLDIRRLGARFDSLPAPREAPGRLEEDGLADALFLSRHDIPALRRAAEQGAGQWMWRKIKAQADRHLDYDPEPHIGQFLPIRRGESLTRRFVEAAPSWEAMIPQLGIAYLVTGDQAYGRQLKRVVLAACRCAEWGTAFIDRFPIGVWGYRAPFYPSHMAGAVALGADMVSNLLSAGEREFIDRALIDKGLFWVRAYLERSEYCRHMNQGVVFATGGLLAALAVEARHPEAAEARRELADYLLDVLDRYLDEDGASGEGPAYWNYTMSQAVKALAPLARRAGAPVASLVTPKLARSIDFPLFLRSLAGDGSMLLNIGDCGYGNRIPSPVLLFFARHLGRADAMQAWLGQYGREDAAPDDPWSFLFFDPRVAPRPMQLPLSKRFRGSDRVVWRSGWRPGEILFMFESGPWGPDHYHHDKQQFLLDAFGERMIVDRGMCDYSNPLSLQLHGSASHNTVTVDGRDQAARSRQPAAALERLEEADGLRYLSSEAGAAYDGLDVFRREALFVRSRYFVLADTLAGVRGRLDWHFHTLLQPERTENGFVLRGRAGSLVVRAFPVSVDGADEGAAPGDWEWQVERLPLDVDVAADAAGAAAASPGPAPLSDHHLTLSPRGRPAQARVLFVLFPVAAGQEEGVIIARRGGPEAGVVRIEQDGARDEVELATVWRSDLRSAFRAGEVPG